MASSDRKSERPGTATWRAIEPYWDAAGDFHDWLDLRDRLRGMPIHVVHLFAVHWCDSEVSNGGFGQFFSNSTGVLGPEAVEGYRAVGLGDVSELVGDAVGLFGKPYPCDRTARRTILERLLRPGEKRSGRGPFSELDDRYFTLKRGRSFYEVLDRYASEHCGG